MKILITAGPTREAIDMVRFITNRSSGKMGYALARAAKDNGWDTVLISGPVNLPPPEGVDCIMVESAKDMATAVKKEAPAADVIIMAAAVADYRPKAVFDGKLKKQEGGLFLELERTEDILLYLGEHKRPGQTLVGFAAEAIEVEANALGKLRKKNLDWIAANDIGAAGCGFAVNTNQVTLYSATGDRIILPLADKFTVANNILDIIVKGKR
ncbi:MAG: phosphopantothenoylcysteine decarboxylase [Victivallaceae bacterium]